MQMAGDLFFLKGLELRDPAVIQTGLLAPGPFKIIFYAPKPPS